MSQEKIDKIKIHDEHNIKGMFNEYRWLSNFHICDVWYEGLKYTSTEAAYQAAKLPPDQRMEFTIMTPSVAMKEGRKRHLDSDIEDWLSKRVDVMHYVTLEKFKDKELRQALLDTGDKYIEETNWWKDQFWGVCDGVGENMLGKIIMSVREHLKDIEKLK